MTLKKTGKSGRNKMPNDPLAWLGNVGKPPLVEKQAATETINLPDIESINLVMPTQPLITIEQEKKMTETAQLEQSAQDQAIYKLLDNMASCYQLADESHNIIYINKSLQTLFTAAESEIKKYLPHFDSKNIVGKNMDFFHKNPAHQRSMMLGLKQPVSTQMRLGNKVFNLRAVPLFDEQGNSKGTMVEWVDVSTWADLTNTVAELANGNVNAELIPVEQCQDEVARLLHAAVKACSDSIKALVGDAEILSVAAVEGRLATRVDASKHLGDYRKIVEGVNNTLDAVIGPLNVAADYVNNIAKGNIPAKITDTYNGDFNILKNNLNTCIDAVNNIIEDATVLSQAIVDGQLNIQADADRHQGDYAKILVAFENAFVGLNNTFYEIGNVVDQVATSADQLNSASQNMASTAEEQSASVEEVTASLAETDSQVKANTDNANAANQLVMGTSQAANQGQEKMEGMIAAMGAINESSQNIAKIIKVIDEIAFQTNLLALNAAVEAARAGQHGRGFAVVAQEVRNLAGRSAKAARETADLIEDSSKRVVEGVGIANETREALDQIVGNVVKVKDLVAEIATASMEQSRGVSQINVAMNQVAKAAQEGSQQAEELAASSNELTNISNQMRNEVRRFKLRERELSDNKVEIAGLEGLTPEMLRQIKAILASQQEAVVAKPKPAVATPKARSKSAKTILPLDADERGFAEF